MATEATRPLRIAVDLTPVLPGGDNGGAKVLTLELLEGLMRLAPQHRFLLLTARRSHDDFARLERDGVERRCILETGPEDAVPVAAVPRRRPLARLYRSWVRPLFPASLRRKANRWAAALRGGEEQDEPLRPATLSEEGVDLLFCPFSSPALAEPGIPVVSVLYDLQHVSYPQFFTQEELAGRAALVRQMERRADRIVCISEYSRRSLLAHVDVPAERAQTVPIAVPSRLPRLSADEVRQALASRGLDRPFILYPANFWPHKNHRLLLVAYGMLLSRRPGIELDLVLTGALPEAARALEEAARAMGLRDRVRFLGYLPERELAALYEACRLVVFPSLYEGFGIPILEALHFGKPIACSNVTSLPEVAGEAAVYFDPRRPEAILEAVGRLLDEPGLAEALVARGRAGLASADPDDMTRSYLRVFDELAGRRDAVEDALTGVFPDGWIGATLLLAHGPRRVLELDLHAPAWLPARRVRVRRESRGGRTASEWTVARGARATVRIDLGSGPERLRLRLSPLFRPDEHGLGADRRLLSCVCEAARTVGEDGVTRDLVSPGPRSA